MASRGGALGSYLGKSFVWLIALAAWPLFVGPQAGPQCTSTASFGFLPAVMVAPFLLLIVYVLSVLVHVVFLFWFWPRAAAGGKKAYLTNAVFFSPVAALSVMVMTWALRWNASVYCSVITVVLVLPALITPLVNAVLLGRPRDSSF
ncbi:MAG: hypothetical protein HY659_06885 [Rhizobiales bacterium]|nr:hypothetical protein [Hyphomicrobiales bacterium]